MFEPSVYVKCKITAKDLILLLKGDLITKGGALRDTSGQIKALPEVILPKPNEIVSHNFPVSGLPVSIISDVVGNIQLDYLQKTVNIIGKKVDLLSNSVQFTKQIACLNSLLSGANLIAFIIGNITILNELSNMEKQIQQCMNKMQGLEDSIKKIEQMLIIEKDAEYKKQTAMMQNLIVDLRQEDKPNNWTHYSEVLICASAFFNELCENFQGKAWEISPKYIFNYAECYTWTLAVYLVSGKLNNKILSEEILDSFVDPYKCLRSKAMRNAMYVFCYNSSKDNCSKEIPLENDLYELSQLPRKVAYSCGSILEPVLKIAVSDESLEKTMELPKEIASKFEQEYFMNGKRKLGITTSSHSKNATYFETTNSYSLR